MSKIKILCRRYKNPAKAVNCRSTLKVSLFSHRDIFKLKKKIHVEIRDTLYSCSYKQRNRIVILND